MTLNNQQTISVPLSNAAIGSTTTILIAASNIALSLKKIVGITLQNQLIGKVTRIQHIGVRVLVTVNITSGATIDANT